MDTFKAPRRRLALAVSALGGGVVVLAAAAFHGELALASRLQAYVFTRFTQQAGHPVMAGASPSIRFPAHGPFDERLGYVQLPEFLKRLQDKGCSITEQARWSERLTTIADWGLFPPYREPTQTGMQVLDRKAVTLLQRRFPEHTYARFEDIPKLIVDTLLFIENRELLDEQDPQRNPAVEVDRLARAILDRAIRVVDRQHPVPGGSTLATQIEKYRHSREGRTDTIRDKLQQMVSASLRAYQDGRDTRGRRKAIILDYLNTVPMAGRPPWGEVHGLGDALRIYFGYDLDEVSHLLATPDDRQTRDATAVAFKAVLSLMVAQRRPATLLAAEHERLELLVARYADLLAEAGIISADLRDATLAAPVRFRPAHAGAVPSHYAERKGLESIRAHLADWLGVSRRYDLDRLHVTVTSTLDARAQHDITAALRRLNDPRAAQAAGLLGPRMLAQGDPARLVYSVTLYEINDQSFRLLVQADNVDQPFDVNEGMKLDLGSTAKLRTLTTYLELIGELHARLAVLDQQALRDYAADPKDVLTIWARNHLLQARDRSLEAMLEAAMQRRYAAHPGESFFTGGGLHSFQNYRREDDARVLSVQQAFHDSVNLVFIRLMRDMVRHYIYRDGEGQVLSNRGDPRRAGYLTRFADHEGRQFLSRFYQAHHQRDAQARLAKLVERRPPNAARLAVLFSTIAPDNYLEVYSAFHATYRGGQSALPPPHAVPFGRYGQHAADAFSLNDRAYIAGIHPLELWLVGYLAQHPAASFAEVYAASSETRQEAYAWLFRERALQAQDRALRTMLERDAFARIHRAWQRVGYPFDTLVPSYATAVGASADRPASLALLMGTILADGTRLPVARVTGLRFAANTPYETRLHCQPNGAQQVLEPAIARALRKALIGVAEHGTAVRVKGLLRTADDAVVVGGKTGTGDHRYKTYAAGGALRESRAVSRAGTFVFFAGERLFGVITAYVSGPNSAQYQFTSALPLQVMTQLTPHLRPLLAPAEPAAAAALASPLVQYGR